MNASALSTTELLPLHSEKSISYSALWIPFHIPGLPPCNHSNTGLNIKRWQRYSEV